MNTRKKLKATSSGEETVKAFIVRVALWNLHASLSDAHREAHDLAGNRKISMPQSKSIE